MLHLKKSLLTLVALLALTTQAWAGIALGDVYKFGSQITFDGSTVVWFKVFSGGAETITTGIHTTQTLTYGGYNSGKHTLTFPSGDGASFMYIVDDNPAEPWGIQVSSGQGTVGNPFVLTAIYDAPLIYHNSSDDAWFVNMPAGNVELQVEYYPGMLVKPTNLVGGTMEIEGLTDTTLPEGFEKDDDGNIYVAKDTKFTVKAVPAEGYHLVGWSDDATNKELEREFTMTDDDFILTATFSDEYDLAFNALNANTIEDGKATVKVGDTDKTATLIQDGKLSVKSGQTVTLTAAQGYKFRSVEAKKAAKAPTLAETLTTAGMTVSVSFLVNGKAETVNFTSNGDGTYTKTGGTGTTATAPDWTIQLVENSGMIVFKAYPSVASENEIMAFKFHFFPSNNTYYMWAGKMAQDLNPTFTSISVNDTAIAVTEAQGN